MGSIDEVRRYHAGQILRGAAAQLPLPQIPGFTVGEGGEITRAVDHAQNRSGFGVEQVNDAVASEDQLAQFCLVEFGHNPSQPRHGPNDFDGPNQPIDKCHCPQAGTPREELLNRSKVALGR
jgi:hypothetical protein